MSAKTRIKWIFLSCFVAVLLCWLYFKTDEPRRLAQALASLDEFSSFQAIGGKKGTLDPFDLNQYPSLKERLRVAKFQEITVDHSFRDLHDFAIQRVSTERNKRFHVAVYERNAGHGTIQLTIGRYGGLIEKGFYTNDQALFDALKEVVLKVSGKDALFR